MLDLPNIFNEIVQEVGAGVDDRHVISEAKFQKFREIDIPGERKSAKPGAPFMFASLALMLGFCFCSC